MGILQSATLHDICVDGLNFLRLECPSRSSTVRRRSTQINTANKERVINSAIERCNDVLVIQSAAANTVCITPRNPAHDHHNTSSHLDFSLIALLISLSYRYGGKRVDFVTKAWLDHDTFQYDFLLKASFINVSSADNVWWLMQSYRDRGEICQALIF